MGNYVNRTRANDESHISYNNVNSEELDVFMNDSEVQYELGDPDRIETFDTGFILRDPIVEDDFIVKYGKYIYKRYVYPDHYVYFFKRKGECYAWYFQNIDT